MSLKPLWDQVVVERAEAVSQTVSGIFIPTTVQEKSQDAVVVAVGAGRLMSDGKIVPPAVNVGDKVLLARHAFTEVKVGGRDLIVVREDAILAVYDEST